MSIVPITFAKRSNPGRHEQAGNQRLINCYVEPAGADARHPEPIYPVDGLTNFATLSGGGACRAALYLEPYLLVVSGRLLFRVDAVGTVSQIGGIPSDGMVTMARNRRAPDAQIVVVCDGLAWVVQSGSLNRITDPDLPPPNSVTAIDGYHVFTCQDGRWFISAIDDATNIDGLDFGIAQANADALVRGFTRGRDLLLFGTQSFEVWSNTGAADFPFQRATSREVGCLAADSVATVDQTVAWVAHDHTVRLLNGYDGQIISTHAVARAIRETADQAEIKGYGYQRDGHTFYSISSADWTWVYNVTTGYWHEEQSYGIARRKLSFVLPAGERLIGGHYAQGRLYTVDRDAHTDGDGDPLIIEAQTVVHAFPAPIRIRRLQVDTLTGVGLATGGTADTSPDLMLRLSADGGRTWHTHRTLPLGDINTPLGEVWAHGLGSYGPAGVTINVSVSAAVRRGLLGMAADIDQLRA